MLAYRGRDLYLVAMLDQCPNRRADHYGPSDAVRLDKLLYDCFTGLNGMGGQRRYCHSRYPAK